MNKTKRITLRFTEQEWQAIVKRAYKHNQEYTMSQYIRVMIDMGEKVDYQGVLSTPGRKGEDW